MAGDLDKFAQMQSKGLPFDVAFALTIDPVKLAQELSIRQLVGEIDTSGEMQQIYKLALVALAFYHPGLIGIEVPDDEDEL